MMSRSIFELKVWQKGDSCLFLLLWNERRRQLSATLNYPKELQKRYQRWQQRYSRFYHFSPPKSVDEASSIDLDGGSLRLVAGDSAHDLTEAEQELLTAFQRWLGEGEVRKIQQEIRDELTVIAQALLVPGKGAGSGCGVDIFLACESELVRLPWEAWELAPEGMRPGTVRIVRTSMDAPDSFGCAKTVQRCRKTRILAILADDPQLPLTEDWKALRSLESIAEVQRVKWEPDENAVSIKNKIARSIADQRGWDVLFFAGHSAETAATGGKLAIAPNIFLSISELEEQLTQARSNGLQLAIFNSCYGLSIANALVQLGLQVVVMREPIGNDVAQSFLKVFCKHLSKHEDALNSLLAACQHLRLDEKFAYPSSYLIPSFFSPPGAIPFSPEPVTWKRWLKQWLPTRQEAIALSTILLLSLMTPLQDWLLDSRTFVQSVYRDITKQLPDNRQPPVLLIAIDSQSINQADAEIEGFQPLPMDREYLAKLVRQLSLLKAKVIGIDYLLDTQQPKQEKLAESIQSAVRQQGTWFIFAVSQEDNLLKVTDKVASSDWSLQGDINFLSWDIKLPTDPTCAQLCPFAYLLALSYTLNQQQPLTGLPQPNLQSKTNFQQDVSQYLKREKAAGKAIAFLKQAYPPLGLRSIIDFSIPPRQVYNRLPAWKFLDRSVLNSELQQRLQKQVAIVVPGGYFDAWDSFLPVPPAIEYWCRSHKRHERNSEDCPKEFTGGEAHAYMIHHLLSQHRVVLIPDLWMVGIAIILGKWTTLVLLKMNKQQRQQGAFVLGTTTAAYGIAGLQVYISSSISIPWFFPAVMLWIYVLLVLREKSYA